MSAAANNGRMQLFFSESHLYKNYGLTINPKSENEELSKMAIKGFDISGICSEMTEENIKNLVNAAANYFVCKKILQVFLRKQELCPDDKGLQSIIAKIQTTFSLAKDEFIDVSSNTNLDIDERTYPPQVDRRTYIRTSRRKTNILRVKVVTKAPTNPK